MKINKRNLKKLFTGKSVAILLVVITIAVAISTVIFSSLKQVATVAEISSGRPFCTNNVKQITGQGSCAPAGFSKYSFRCSDGKLRALTFTSNDKTIQATQCHSFAEASAMIVDICGKTCLSSPPTPTTTPAPEVPVVTPISTRIPEPWPSPTSRPTPPPTSDPSAKPPTCTLEVHRIPRVASGDAPYIPLNPTGASVSVGDKLVYDISVTNPNNYAINSSIAVMTANLNGNNEPIKPLRYSPLCTLNPKGKTLFCNLGASYNLPSNSTVGISDAQFVVEVTNPGNIVSTGINYSLKVGTLDVQCYPYSVTFIKSTIAPTPRHTPAPKPKLPRCITLFGHRFCLPLRAGLNVTQ